MKANKGIVVFFTAAMLSLPITGCGSSANGQEVDNSNVKSTADAGSGMDVLQSSYSQNTDAGSLETYKAEAFYLKEGQEAGLEEEVEYDGCAWVISDIKITKEIGDRLQADFNYWGEEMDGYGNLTGSESYIFVTVSCKNMGDTIREIRLNSYRFAVTDESGQIYETAAEARYISTVQKENSDPVEVFHYILEPGKETGQVEIGYIIEDNCMDDYANLYYCIGQQGSMLGDPENRYIKVDTGR